jgi:hypothetical protein
VVININHQWSIQKTADTNGVAVKPPKGGAHHYEVCVADRHGMLQINVYCRWQSYPKEKTMNLNDRALLVQLNVSQWTARKYDKKAPRR